MEEERTRRRAEEAAAAHQGGVEEERTRRRAEAAAVWQGPCQRGVRVRERERRRCDARVRKGATARLSALLDIFLTT